MRRPPRTAPIRGTRSVKLPPGHADAPQVRTRSGITLRPPEAPVLYQDARWPLRGRLLFGVLYPFLAAAVIGGVLNHDPIGTDLILAAGFLLPIAICEWRARRMGFKVTDDGIDLIRAVNHSFVPWESFDGFVLRKPAGAVDYGQRTVWIKRATNGRLPKGLLPVPTLYVTPQHTRWFTWMGPGGIKWSGGTAPDTASFLDQLTATHRPS